MVEKSQSALIEKEKATLSKLRANSYRAAVQAEKTERRKSGSKSRLGVKYRDFMHELTSLLISRALILGPLERLKIVMQVSPIANYANPKSDKPKNIPDLFSKVMHNQGMFAFYRGINAFIYKTTIQYGAKFLFYEYLLGTTFK